MSRLSTVLRAVAAVGGKAARRHMLQSAAGRHPPLLARGMANHLPLSDPWKLLGITRSADLPEIKAAFKLRALQTHPDQNQDESTHYLFQQVKKAYDLVVDLKLKELAGDDGPVAQRASGVLPLYAKELDKCVRDGDWAGGWETWEAIQAMDEEIPSVFFGEIMTNVFRLCYGDHENNSLYVKKRVQLTEGGGEDAAAAAGAAASSTPLALADDDWVHTAIHVIHDAVETKTVADDTETLGDCFTKLLWVAKDKQDVDSANKINDQIDAHGLPASIAQVLMQELYREVYHTRGC